MKMLSQYTFLIFLLFSCKNINPEEFYTEDELELKANKFQERRARLKRQSENHNLEQKALFFEAVIKDNFPDSLAIIPKFYGEKVGHLYRVDLNAHLLAAMAFKYKCTNDRADFDLIIKHKYLFKMCINCIL